MKLFHVNPQTDFLSECAGAFDAAPQLAVVTWQMGLQMALKVTLPVASERTNLEGKIRKGLFKKNQASIKLNCKLKVAKLGLLKYDWVVQCKLHTHGVVLTSHCSFLTPSWTSDVWSCSRYFLENFFGQD